MGVDRAIFFTVLTRGWNASAGLVTIFLVSHFLSPVLQGYYYTFYSLIALQVFAELGLTYSTFHQPRNGKVIMVIRWHHYWEPRIKEALTVVNALRH